MLTASDRAQATLLGTGNFTQTSWTRYQRNVDAITLENCTAGAVLTEHVSQTLAIVFVKRTCTWDCRLRQQKAIFLCFFHTLSWSL